MNKRKKKHIAKFVIVILVIFIPLSLTSAFTASKVLKPKKANSKTTIVVSGKNRTYYLLHPENPTLVTAKGSGTLKIITRLTINPEKKNALDYLVYYSVNGAPKIKVDFKQIKKDVKARFKDKPIGIPGTVKSFVIELSRGDNSIEFWSGTRDREINTRYLFTERKEKKIDWVSLSPLHPNEPVSLVTNENVVTYYRFSSNHPLKIKITGPTTLKVFSRVENHYQMKGRIDYRLQVKEDKAIKNTYQLSSVRSEVTVYKKGCGKTPGKAKEILITVPGGTHYYEIVPLDKNKDSVLARVLFPKKDVKIKE